MKTLRFKRDAVWWDDCGLLAPIELTLLKSLRILELAKGLEPPTV
jgi:hypothetical protein